MLADQEFSVFPVRRRSRRLEPDEVSLTKTNVLISAELATAQDGVLIVPLKTPSSFWNS